MFPDAIDLRSSFSVEPMQRLMTRNVRTDLYILLAAVAFVLLIACAIATLGGARLKLSFRCHWSVGLISNASTFSAAASCMCGRT